jgi:hypothetical protein
MSLIQQLAMEVFHAGKPLEELVNDLVKAEYNRFLDKAKALIREGRHFEAVRDSLIDGGLSLPNATNIAYSAAHLVATELANEKQLNEATAAAQHLFGNGCRFDSVVNHLLSKGCARDLAERVVRENQHFYK